MIEAVELTKRHGSTIAVDRLSFTVCPGQVTGFLGPNGAGKSSTMRMILGLDAPTSGTVTLNGRRYASIRQPLHEVGAVLDARAVHPGRSAYHHLLFLAQSNGIPARRVGAVLELVGLDGAARRRAGAFSLGMSQRLGLAAALLGDPPILLCDEPVNGLDPEGIRWIRRLLRGLAAEGRTVFVSSHLMSEMALTADHLIVIGHGRLLADASTHDLIADSSRNYVRLRTPETARLAEILRRAGADPVEQSRDGETVMRVDGLDAAVIGDLAARHGVALHELTEVSASLEDAYLQLTHDQQEFQTERATTGRLS